MKLTKQIRSWIFLPFSDKTATIAESRAMVPARYVLLIEFASFHFYFNQM